MAQYLELLENPRRKKRSQRYNPIGFDEFNNPITFYNPRRKRRKRRNPMAKALAMPGTFKEWTQGVDLMDAGAAVGGLAASTMIPGMVIKTTDTGGQKFMKLLVSLGCAIGAGALGKAMINVGAGKAAITGGIAGTAAQAIGMFTTFQIGQPTHIANRPIRRVGEATQVPSRGELPVTMIQP